MTVVPASSQVEIAPGEWLAINSTSRIATGDVTSLPSKTPPRSTRKKEASGLFFVWNGKQVEWNGKEIPISLREHEANLYMVGFDRSNSSRHILRFFALSDKGNRFRQIKPDEYPRAIATQNMWLTSRYVNINGKKVDILAGLRRLDLSNAYFDHSFTAYMWYQIEKGVELHEMPRLIDEAFLKDYVKRYEPIALPTIIKENKPNQ